MVYIAKQQLLTRIKRYKALNQMRLQHALALMGHEARFCLSVVPVLLHYNHVNLVGYRPNAPHGIDLFSLNQEQQLYLNNAISSDAPLLQNPTQRAILGIYAMGSTSSLGQGVGSDLDLWVCTKVGLSADELTILQDKCRLISSYAKSRGVELNLFVTPQDRFTNFQPDSLDDENCGSAQNFFLLDEFYRTSIRICGRYILWYLISSEEESTDYHAYTQFLLKGITGLPGYDVSNTDGMVVEPNILPEELIEEGQWPIDISLGYIQESWQTSSNAYFQPWFVQCTSPQYSQHHVNWELWAEHFANQESKFNSYCGEAGGSTISSTSFMDDLDIVNSKSRLENGLSSIKSERNSQFKPKFSPESNSNFSSESASKLNPKSRSENNSLFNPKSSSKLNLGIQLGDNIASNATSVPESKSAQLLASYGVLEQTQASAEPSCLIQINPSHSVSLSNQDHLNHKNLQSHQDNQSDQGNIHSDFGTQNHQDQARSALMVQGATIDSLTAEQGDTTAHQIYWRLEQQSKSKLDVQLNQGTVLNSDLDHLITSNRKVGYEQSATDALARNEKTAANTEDAITFILAKALAGGNGAVTSVEGLSLTDQEVLQEELVVSDTSLEAAYSFSERSQNLNNRSYSMHLHDNELWVLFNQTADDLRAALTPTLNINELSGGFVKQNDLEPRDYVFSPQQSQLSDAISNIGMYRWMSGEHIGHSYVHSAAYDERGRLICFNGEGISEQTVNSDFAEESDYAVAVDSNLNVNTNTHDSSFAFGQNVMKALSRLFTHASGESRGLLSAPAIMTPSLDGGAYPADFGTSSNMRGAEQWFGLQFDKSKAHHATLTIEQDIDQSMHLDDSAEQWASEPIEPSLALNSNYHDLTFEHAWPQEGSTALRLGRRLVEAVGVTPMPFMGGMETLGVFNSEIMQSEALWAEQTSSSKTLDSESIESTQHEANITIAEIDDNSGFGEPEILGMGKNIASTRGKVGESRANLGENQVIGRHVAPSTISANYEQARVALGQSSALFSGTSNTSSSDAHRLAWSGEGDASNSQFNSALSQTSPLHDASNSDTLSHNPSSHSLSSLSLSKVSLLCQSSEHKITANQSAATQTPVNKTTTTQSVFTQTSSNQTTTSQSVFTQTQARQVISSNHNCTGVSGHSKPSVGNWKETLPSAEHSTLQSTELSRLQSTIQPIQQDVELQARADFQLDSIVKSRDSVAVLSMSQSNQQTSHATKNGLSYSTASKDGVSFESTTKEQGLVSGTPKARSMVKSANSGANQQGAVIEHQSAKFVATGHNPVSTSQGVAIAQPLVSGAVGSGSSVPSSTAGNKELSVYGAQALQDSALHMLTVNESLVAAHEDGWQELEAPLDETEWFDFGSISKCSPTEYFGSGLWLLYKAIDSPFKVVLKILLMEAYSSDYTQSRLLASDLKDYMLSHDGYSIDLDAYYLMYLKVSQYLQRTRDPRLTLMRKCFYLKIFLGISQKRPYSNADYRLKRGLLNKFSSRWGWSEDFVRQLERVDYWKMAQVREFSQEVYRALFASYQALLRFSVRHGIEYAITSDDAGILSRKLYAAFDLYPGKILIMHKNFSNSIEERNLTFIKPSASSLCRRGWHLYTTHPEDLGLLNMRAIYVGSRLCEVVTWASLNGLLTSRTINYVCGASSMVTPLKIKQLSSDVIRVLKPKLFRVNERSLQRTRELRGCVVLLNLEQDPTALISNRMLDIDMGSTLCCGRQRICLIGSVDLVLINSWGEVRSITLPCGEDGVVELLATMLRIIGNSIEPDHEYDNYMADTAKNRQHQNTKDEGVELFDINSILNAIKVCCYASAYADLIKYDMENIMRQVINCLSASNSSEFLFDVGRNSYMARSDGRRGVTINLRGVFASEEFDIRILSRYGMRPEFSLQVPAVVDRYATVGIVQYFFSAVGKNKWDIYIINERNEVSIYKNFVGSRAVLVNAINRFYTSQSQGATNSKHLNHFNLPQYFVLNKDQTSLHPFTIRGEDWQAT